MRISKQDRAVMGVIQYALDEIIRCQNKLSDRTKQELTDRLITRIGPFTLWFATLRELEQYWKLISKD